MPDLEAKIELPESPLSKLRNSETTQSDNETDNFEDARDASLTEPDAGQTSPTEPPLIRQALFSVDPFESKKTKKISLKSLSISDIPPEVKEDPNSCSNSPTTKPLSPTPSLRWISNGSTNHVNLDRTVSSKINSPEENSSDSSTQTSPALHPSLKSPLFAAYSRFSPPPKTSPVHDTTNILPFIPALQSAQHFHPPPTRTRKLTSPFLWWTRNLGKEINPTMTTPSTNFRARRGTISSIITNRSSSEGVMNNVDQAQESDSTKNIKRAVKSNLKDRFKILRMREEGGSLPILEKGEIENNEPEQDNQRNIDSTQIRHQDDRWQEISSPKSVPASSPNSSTSPDISVPISCSSSPSVDWDLWQAVVDEGPAAVARTSPEELNRAITKGIPNVIRGVVWQILAQSKNEELEKIYKRLVARGIDKDNDKIPGSKGSNESTSSTPSLNSGSNKEETELSSSSSVNSDYSVAVNSTTNGIKSPSSCKQFESLIKVQAEKKKKAQDEVDLLKKLEKTIKRDLGARTSFSKFATSAGLQEGLFGVCKAYALYDEGVGYAQGMNFLAMPLLFNMPEDEAFCLLVRIMNQYHLRDLFIQDMPGLHMRLYQFERLLEDLEPALYCHLQRRQITPHLYATQWFLTLFAYRFPLQLVLRIYDLILSQGLEAIIKFGIVLMQKNAATLLGISEMTTLTKFLKDRLFDVYIDGAPSSGSILESGFFGSSGSSIDREVYRADQLVRDACAVKITSEMLKTYTQEWEEKTRIEKMRELEIENLKLTCKKLVHKVRRLEGRIQDHDSEHTALATELVRTKVQNQELRDENESLKIQVQEYRDMMEKLPQEVEQRLKTEMDRLLKRNQEVHDENNRLEEEMCQMEKTLVETKMKYAEINATHETLTRKWIDLRKALD